MPFFQGAYNFQIQGGNFVDSSNSTHNVTHNTYNQSPSPDTSGSRRRTTTDSALPKLAQVPERQAEDTKRERLTGILSPFYSLYKLFLLRLPNLYLSRIERLGGNAVLARERMFEMATTTQWESPPLVPRTGKAFLNHIMELESNVRSATSAYDLPASYLSLGIKWGGFVDSLLSEWQTLNLVSALLVPGVLTVFQIDGASNDPITRYLAFWSLISALLSLLYGCLFVIQFSQLKKTTVGIEWMMEALDVKSITLLWAVDIMLALPAIWLTWSILACIVCIMTFLWRAGPIPPDDFMTPHQGAVIEGFRIFISVILGIGAAYAALIFYTFRRYGLNLDAAIAKEIDERLGIPPADKV